MSANPDNRIEIACYNTECECFAPLASYKPGTDGAYVDFEYDKSDRANTYMISASGLKSRTSSDDSYTDVTLKSRSVSGDTHTQYGIAQACDHFVNTSLNNADFGDQDRTPFVLFMTDGHSLMSSIDWYNQPPADSTKYYTADEGEDREDAESKSYRKDNDYAVSALTVLTAAYQKKLIQEKYRSDKLNNDSATEVQWFNIGIGVDPINDVASAKCFQLMLDPSKISDTSKIYKDYLKEYVEDNPEYISLTDIAYCDSGCVSFADTPNTIKSAFNSLGDAVADSSGNTVLPITSTTIDGGCIYYIYRYAWNRDDIDQSQR